MADDDVNIDFDAESLVDDPELDALLQNMAAQKAEMKSKIATLTTDELVEFSQAEPELAEQAEALARLETQGAPSEVIDQIRDEVVDRLATLAVEVERG